MTESKKGTHGGARPNSGPRFTRTERARVKAEIVALDAAGHTLRQIATIVGCSHSTVDRALGDARDLWRRQAMIDTEAERMRTLAMIDWWLGETAAGFRRSQMDRQTVEATTTGERAPAAKGKGKTTAVAGAYREKVKVDKSIGDAVWIRAADSLLKHRSELLGLAMPHAGAGRGDGGPDAGSIQMNTYNVLLLPDKDDMATWQEKYTKQLESGQHEVIDAGESGDDPESGEIAIGEVDEQ